MHVGVAALAVARAVPHVCMSGAAVQDGQSGCISLPFVGWLRYMSAGFSISCWPFERGYRGKLSTVLCTAVVTVHVYFVPYQQHSRDCWQIASMTTCLCECGLFVHCFSRCVLRLALEWAGILSQEQSELMWLHQVLFVQFCGLGCRCRAVNVWTVLMPGGRLGMG